MNRKSNYLIKKAALTIFISIGLYVITYLLDSEAHWNNFLKLPMSKKLIDLLINLAFCLIIVETSLFIDRKMNVILPWTKYSVSRLLVQSFVQTVVTFLLLFLFAIVFLLVLMVFKIESKEFENPNIDFLQFSIALMILVLIVCGINTVNYLSKNWKSAIEAAAEHQINAAKSKQIATETELQALRLQLDPHFVFNNLSVLSELILKDQQLGYEYAENFAKVYRYLLINSKKEVISLKEELKFLDAYLFLLKNRMGKGVVFEIDVDDKITNLKLPPVTLQLLVENAIKHNRIDKENPLKITLSVNELEELAVENTLLPLLKSPHSSGIGLENIKSRYALLSDKTIKIEQSESSFIVKIPLLK